MVINNKTTNTIEKSTTNLRVHELNYTAIKVCIANNALW
jgi:hypothetical protein